MKSSTATFKNKSIGALLLLFGIILILGFSIIIIANIESSFFASSENQSNIFIQFGSSFFEFFLHSFGYSSFLIPIFFLKYGNSFFTKYEYKISLHKISALLILIPTFSVLISMIIGEVEIFTQQGIVEVGDINLEEVEGQRRYHGGYVGYYTSNLLSIRIPQKTLLIAVSFFSFVLTFIAFDISFRATISKIWMLIKEKAKQIKYRSDNKRIHDKSQHNLIESNFQDKIKGNLDKITKAKSDISGFTNMKLNFEDPSSSFNVCNLNFLIPATSLLNQIPQQKNRSMNDEMINLTQVRLMQVLDDFGIRGNIVNVSCGPVATMYEIEPAAGTKSSRVIGLADDIARSMKAQSARISVISMQNTIGIELPNQIRETVSLRKLLEHPSYTHSEAKIPIILGENISGEICIIDLANAPHLLIAGTTGSGKSVAINNIILSILYKHTPDICKLILIDPKMLELSAYKDICHLCMPVITNARLGVEALQWAVKEMESRYNSMSMLGVRNIDAYNMLMQKSDGDIVKKVQIGFDEEKGTPLFEEMIFKKNILPRIVIIIDEMADLMLVAGKEIEELVQRLAQMARAAGIYVIMATQRPSVDVITGVIKANFPTRISFQVVSKFDSRTILGEMGAEQLLGKGDMLYMPSGGKAIRIHAPFVSDDEVENVANFIRQSAAPQYIKTFDEIDVNTDEKITSSELGIENIEDRSSDESLYRSAIEIVIKDGKASISYVQRVLRIGYNRAALLIERMEKEGIISSPNHVGKREILKPNPYQDS